MAVQYHTLDNKILSICMSIVTPLILIFGFYIQFHGEVSPGGGFQSGIIFAIPFIAYILLYGNSTNQGAYLIESGLFKNIGCCGVLIYLFTGVLTNLMGGKFLEYAILASEAHRAQQIGIFVIETGVCLAVFGAMLTIFISIYKFAIED